jgi:cytochrome b subunit of formate dehydrogenase
MEEHVSAYPEIKTSHAEHYFRFDVVQRIEHLVFLLSFTILGITGLAQRYAESSTSLALFNVMGGIENSRQIHHASAFVMMIVSTFHVLEVIYRLYVLRVSWTMLPLFDDFKHLFQDLGYYFGLRKHKAYYGRYNYAEKVEYLAVVWGTIIMGLTGFMMWNPVTTTQYLPGEWIVAAKSAHSWEAVLAVLAIIIWHFYHVHLKRFNKSMFNGKLSREEMEEEHPAELALIESGEAWVRPPKDIVRKREIRYYPVALIISAAMIFGAVKFVSIESTAITTIPEGETAQVFVPITPTPRPSPTLLPTPDPGEAPVENSWEARYAPLFDNRCGTCHGITKVGGLSLATYAEALAGGDNGPAIVPGDSDASILVQIQLDGNHPGQLTADELSDVVEWIDSGALEK